MQSSEQSGSSLRSKLFKFFHLASKHVTSDSLVFLLLFGFTKLFYIFLSVIVFCSAPPLESRLYRLPYLLKRSLSDLYFNSTGYIILICLLTINIFPLLSWLISLLSFSSERALRLKVTTLRITKSLMGQLGLLASSLVLSITFLKPFWSQFDFINVAVASILSIVTLPGIVLPLVFDFGLISGFGYLDPLPIIKLDLFIFLLEIFTISIFSYSFRVDELNYLIPFLWLLLSSFTMYLFNSLPKSKSKKMYFLTGIYLTIQFALSLTAFLRATFSIQLSTCLFTTALMILTNFCLLFDRLKDQIESLDDSAETKAKIECLCYHLGRLTDHADSENEPWVSQLILILQSEENTDCLALVSGDDSTASKRKVLLSRMIVGRIKTLFEKGIRDHPQDNHFKILYAKFLIEWLKSRIKTEELIVKLKRNSRLSYFEKYELFHLELAISGKSGPKMSNFVSSEKMLLKLHFLILEALNSKIEVLSFIQKRLLDFSVLISRIHQFYRICLQVEDMFKKFESSLKIEVYKDIYYKSVQSQTSGWLSGQALIRELEKAQNDLEDEWFNNPFENLSTLEIPFIIFQLSESGKNEVIKVSKNLCKIYDTSEHELISEGIEILMPPNFRKEHVDIFENFVLQPTEKQVYHKIVYPITRNGEIIASQLKFSLFHEPSNHFVYIFSLLSPLPDQESCHLYVTSRSGQIVYTSLSFETLFGFPRDYFASNLTLQDLFDETENILNKLEEVRFFRLYAKLKLLPENHENTINHKSVLLKLTDFDIQEKTGKQLKLISISLSDSNLNTINGVARGQSTRISSHFDRKKIKNESTVIDKETFPKIRQTKLVWEFKEFKLQRLKQDGLYDIDGTQISNEPTSEFIIAELREKEMKHSSPLDQSGVAKQKKKSGVKQRAKKILKSNGSLFHFIFPVLIIGLSITILVRQVLFYQSYVSLIQVEEDLILRQVSLLSLCSEALENVVEKRTRSSPGYIESSNIVKSLIKKMLYHDANLVLNREWVEPWGAEEVYRLSYTIETLESQVISMISTYALNDNPEAEEFSLSQIKLEVLFPLVRDYIPAFDVVFEGFHQHRVDFFVQRQSTEELLSWIRFALWIAEIFVLGTIFVLQFRSIESYFRQLCFKSPSFFVQQVKRLQQIKKTFFRKNPRVEFFFDLTDDDELRKSITGFLRFYSRKLRSFWLLTLLILLLFISGRLIPKIPNSPDGLPVPTNYRSKQPRCSSLIIFSRYLFNAFASSMPPGTEILETVRTQTGLVEGCLNQTLDMFSSVLKLEMLKPDIEEVLKIYRTPVCESFPDSLLCSAERPEDLTSNYAYYLVKQRALLRNSTLDDLSTLQTASNLIRARTHLSTLRSQ